MLDLELIAINRLGLAVDDTDKVGSVTSAFSRIDFEINGVASSCAQLAGIADDGSRGFIGSQYIVSLHQTHGEAKYEQAIPEVLHV